MTELPKWLEGKRDEANHEREDTRTRNSIIGHDYTAGFNACAEILLPEIEIAKIGLTALLAKLDDGTLCRDISNDHKSDYILRMLDLVEKLALAQEALTRINERFPK